MFYLRFHASPFLPLGIPPVDNEDTLFDLSVVSPSSPLPFFPSPYLLSEPIRSDLIRSYLSYTVLLYIYKNLN